MKTLTLLVTVILCCSITACKTSTAVVKNTTTTTAVPFDWSNANIYFLLTDRFFNGNTANDVNFNRNEPTAPLRGFMGGDIAGITQKIKEGYFQKLGVNAIWLTPVVEQTHSAVDEGTGVTYGYHGYWAKDWTAIDPNFGTKEELLTMVKTAHQAGIKVVFDVVLNHTGPATEKDPLLSKDWVRTSPKCDYSSYKTTTACTLVENLPDVFTESEKPVDLPELLRVKWEKEGRLQEEMQELNQFFTRTGYPRAPKYYLIKWLTDFIREYGVDGFRVDTAKHLEEDVWKELRKQADVAFAITSLAQPKIYSEGQTFYMVGEVYNYFVSKGRLYDFGDKKVDYFDNGFDALINFDFKSDANKDYETIFSTYATTLNKSDFQGKTILNYISSHDDGSPFDKDRTKSIEGATKLLLCPGGVQIYYGDEVARPLQFTGAKGDANLRTFMDWNDIANNPKTKTVLAHWQKLGTFRNQHIAIGAGQHQMLSASPYTFKRTYNKNGINDKVVVGLGLPQGKKKLTVNGVFEEGEILKDHYSGMKAKVINGTVEINSSFDIVLLEAVSSK